MEIASHKKNWWRSPISIVLKENIFKHDTFSVEWAGDWPAAISLSQARGRSDKWQQKWGLLPEQSPALNFLVSKIDFHDVTKDVYNWAKMSNMVRYCPITCTSLQLSSYTSEMIEQAQFCTVMFDVMTKINPGLYFDIRNI